MLDAGEYQGFEAVAACPLCRHQRLRTIAAVSHVVACANCGFRFVSPRPTQDEIARGYSSPESYATWLAETEARRELWRRRFDAVLGPWPTGSLLDVGAGLGTFLSIASDRGWTVTGTEVSSTAIEYAAAAYGIEVVCGQLEEVDLKAGFDVITLWHVIEHVPDPVATLRVCRALLAPGGRVVLALPNDSAAAQTLSTWVRLVRWALHRKTRPRYERLRPGTESHLSHFTPRTLRFALNSAGLESEFESVDDAAPTRSSLGRVVFGIRRVMTVVTPWNLGTEMLVVARINDDQPDPPDAGAPARS